MPTVHIPIKKFNRAFGKDLTFDELEKICFDFGIELELKDDEEEHKYIFEVASNRADLLSIEGIVKSLKIFLGDIKMPDYKIVNKNTELEQMRVEASTNSIRPYVVCAVLRDIEFTEESYQSFIDFQDKLHQNIARKRTLVAIGTHDYDTIKGPFVYKAVKPEDLSFIPLNQTEKMDGNRLMNFYENDLKLREYLYIIKDSPVYPIIYDSNNVVLSLPPIINGDHSKISLNTKNVFIEITATDYTRANIVLNLIVATFSEYCKNKFTFEQVKVSYEQNDVYTETLTPSGEIRNMKADVEYINGIAGTKLTAAQQIEQLEKMGLHGQVIDEKTIEAAIDITRQGDILHACDIAEEVAIGYGYNNVEAKVPTTLCYGKQQSLEKFANLLRGEIANAGYVEILNFVLCSIDDVSKNLRYDEKRYIEISNPQTLIFQTARTQIISGLLRTLNSNKKKLKLPISLFEIGDTIIKADNPVGAANVKRLGLLYTSRNTSGFELIHGMLDYVMTKVNAVYDEKKGYSIKPCNIDMLFPEMQGEVMFKGESIGYIGVLHPEVLKNYEWEFPISVLDINIEALYKHYFEN